MQTDPHKLDFRSDLLARLPGAGGLGPLGPIGGALPPTHDLTRPPTLFPATGDFSNLGLAPPARLSLTQTSPVGHHCRLTGFHTCFFFLFFFISLQDLSIHPWLPLSLLQRLTPLSFHHLRIWVSAP